jgi:hypothetical protein
MRTYVLTDVSREHWVESFAIDATGFQTHQDAKHSWSVTKRTLRGGRRDGVDLIELDNGALRMSIVPTRGMGLWKGSFRGLRLGWTSPVLDGPVNPSYVNLASTGGLGWLDGFDELLARCGLENNGAPYTEGGTTYSLHGKIANIPASYVAVHVAEETPYEITVEGHVEEVRLFGLQVRLATRISTVPGSNRLVVRDEFVNLKDQDAEIQALYHWNFGPPFLEEGSRFVAPFKTITPRDPHAQAALSRHNVYEGPRPGFREECYFYELQARATDSNQTLALLRNRAGDRGVALRFSNAQLPAFTLWKNTGGPRDGYATGLEPGTNYPNPRPFEKARGRVVTLPPDGRYVTETTLEVLDTADAVSAAESEIALLQAIGVPEVNASPKEPYAPEG